MANFIAMAKPLLRYGDLMIFFKVAAICYLGFLKIAVRFRKATCIKLPNFTAIGQVFAEI